MMTRAKSPVLALRSAPGDRIAISACWGSMDSGYTCESNDSGWILVLDTAIGYRVAEILVGDGWLGGFPLATVGNLCSSTRSRKLLCETWHLIHRDTLYTIDFRFS